MVRNGMDDVSGVVIGSMVATGWLRYDGRPQGSQLVAATWREVVKLGNERMEQLKAEYKGICYDDGKVWEVTS